MKIIVTENYQTLSQKTAEIVVDLVKEKPNLVFCLPAGGSPIGMYECLVQMYKDGKVDFSNMITFDMDEYVGLEPTNENSYAYFMQKHFLKYVNVKPENVFYPHVASGDVDAECVRYSQQIIDYNGLDLAITGIGDDGHIAFNEPHTYLLPRTHAVDLKESTIAANARFFNDISEVPKRAVSIGMEEIMKCRNFLVVASGENKAPLLGKMFENDHLDPMYPVSFLRMHPNVTFILDKAAASRIPKKELEYFV